MKSVAQWTATQKNMPLASWGMYQNVPASCWAATVNNNEQLKDNVHKFMICLRGRKSDKMDSTGVWGERGVGERGERRKRTAEGESTVEVN